MNGRKLIGPTLLALLLCFGLAEAQQPKKFSRIGFLSQAPVANAILESFRNGLRDLNYTEGKDIIVEYRDAKGDPARLGPLASDLVGQNVDVIVSWVEKQRSQRRKRAVQSLL